MSDARRRIRQQAAVIDDLPYGVARTAAAEALVRKVESEGPDDLLPAVLLDLLEAHTFGHTPERSFVTFAHLVRLWDAHPESFDRMNAHRFFWGFKWVAGDLPDLPQISRTQAETFLDDMEDRFALAGHSRAAVLGARFRWLWHAGRPEAEAMRLEWVQAEQDELDDCEACLIGQQVDYFTEIGEYPSAVVLGAGQSGSCNLEPTRTLYAMALAQLMTGDTDGAARSHRLGRGSLRLDDSDFAPARGQEVELLARGGHFELALLRLRDEHSTLLLTSSTPLFRLRFLLAVLAGLAANRDAGDTPTHLDVIDAPTAADLLAWVERETRSLAVEFDQRGNTDYYARLIDRALNAERASATLPLELPSIQPEAAVEAEAVDHDSLADGGGAGVGRAADPLVQAEQLAARGQHGQAADAYEAASATAIEAGRLADAGLALAEAAYCAELAADPAHAHRLYATAWPLLVAGEAPADLLMPVAVAWAPVAWKAADPGSVLAALDHALTAVADVDHASMADELAQRRRRELCELRASGLDAMARTMGSIPPAQRAPGRQAPDAAKHATDAAELYAHIGKTYDAAHGFWLAGRLQGEAADLEAAIWSLESAVEGFALAHRTTERAEAAGELIELLRQTGQHDRVDDVVQALLN